jgi:hypothetical protein
MMHGDITRIEIEGEHITATFEHANGIGDDTISLPYDEDSAIALCVDLLARLLIQETAFPAIHIAPASGAEVRLARMEES